MSKSQTLSFVACQNHYSKDGFYTNEGFNKIYPLGDGMFKCSLCGKEFTREEIRRIVEEDFKYMVADLTRGYQQNLAKLYSGKEENLNIVDAATAGTRPHWGHIDVIGTPCGDQWPE